MNLSKPLSAATRIIHGLFLRARAHLPRQRSVTFSAVDPWRSGIGPIYVINLDRQKGRWNDMMRELGRILDANGMPLSERVVRWSACDAQAHPPEFVDRTIVQPFYTLGHQLFVEPQPDVAPDVFDLERPIRMSHAEVAIACSHISLWRMIAQSSAPYTLVLEDDVWFARDFGRIIDKAWREMEEADGGNPRFDILYVSYGEVRNGAPKELVSPNLFRPERGLWYLSGYVISKKGAQALLGLLPCCGPIDLWINHQFGELDVRALRRSVVNQRRDLHSTNSYSILPALSRIGVLNNGNSELFHGRPIHSPVFAFGAPGSGLSSLAMALSLLGYRCCSDFDSIPECELERLLAGSSDRVFDAYVNIASLETKLPVLIRLYPAAKYILIDGQLEFSARSHPAIGALNNVSFLRLRPERTPTWRDLCEFLNLAPPNAEYPSVSDIGLRIRELLSPEVKMVAPAKRLRHDPSPWTAKQRGDWIGITESALERQQSSRAFHECFDDDLADIQSSRWLLRNDTFPGNLGLFRPANVRPAPGGGLSLVVLEEPLGVRKLSAAAISTQGNFLFGRFEATLQASKVPGLVTGFFLHRDSPRQEIDVEILGNRTDQLLVNVFYNPGTDGAKFDYGYRGTPIILDLGFDASQAFHQYTIEWNPCEIKWLVDHKLVHRRVIWDPTPIPHLPMRLHVNAWPTASRELAGRIALRALPASAIVRRVAVHIYDPDSRGQLRAEPTAPALCGIESSAHRTNGTEHNCS